MCGSLFSDWITSKNSAAFSGYLFTDSIYCCFATTGGSATVKQLLLVMMIILRPFSGPFVRCLFWSIFVFTKNICTRIWMWRGVLVICVLLFENAKFNDKNTLGRYFSHDARGEYDVNCCSCGLTTVAVILVHERQLVWINMRTGPSHTRSAKKKRKWHIWLTSQLSFIVQKIKSFFLRRWDAKKRERKRREYVYESFILFLYHFFLLISLQIL